MAEGVEEFSQDALFLAIGFSIGGGQKAVAGADCFSISRILNAREGLCDGLDIKFAMDAEPLELPIG
jgi:hypothetical protein